MNYTIVPFKGPDADEGGQCELLGSFALLVQGALGLLALSSLVFKRWRERPQRPLKIWFFDVSKQVVGSVLVHIANLVMAMFSSGTLPGSDDDDEHDHPPVHSPEEDLKYHPNPCSFYLLNLLIDTTVGILILIYAVRVLTILCRRLPSTWAFSHGITTGAYGHPPKVSNWLKQSLLYFAGLMIMKFVVLIIFSVAPWLGHVGDWALKWTENNKALQIAFVMFIFPLIMNGMQYYIIDSFIKGKEEKEEISEAQEEEAEAQNEPGLQPSSAVGVVSGKGEDDESDDEEQASGSSSRKSLLRKDSKKMTKVKAVEEYDPERDGDVVGGTNGQIKLVDHT